MKASPSRRRADLTFGGGPETIEWERHFHLDDRRIGSPLGDALSQRESDLLDIATAAYITDRVTPRRPSRRRGPEDQFWSRSLRMTIAVRDPEFWGAADVRAVLGELLMWLTDDEWDLTFEAGVRWRRPAETQPSLWSSEVVAGTRIGLFSGGLDSVAGAALELEASASPLVLVSAATQNQMRVLQQLTADELRRNQGGPIRSLVVPISLIGASLADKNLDKDAETTQRSRGMVFLALGLVAAMNSGIDELRVYENGVGALNLPQGEAQLGSMATRAMHPRTLALAGRLGSFLAERPVTVLNPSLWMTKAEMCRALPAWAHEAAARSLSCDTGLTRRVAGRREFPLCGECTSCLLRRQALLAGGLAALDSAEATRYRADVFAPNATRGSTLPLRDMLAQAWALDRALSDGQPWIALLNAFPALLDAVDHVGPRASYQLLRLLQAYVAEWRSIDAPIVRRYLPTTLGARLA